MERLELEKVPGRRGAREAGALLARTFHDDPYAVYSLPDAATRPAVLAAAFTWMVGYGQSYGLSLRTPGRLDGVAILLPPSPGHYAPERLAATGYQRFERAVGPELWPGLRERHDAVFGHCEEVIQRVVPEDYFCLDVLGVDAALRGQGVGSALIQALHDPHGKGGPGSYILSFQPRNVPFYERNGYEIVAAEVEPGSGLRFWVMTHPPTPRTRRRR